MIVFDLCQNSSDALLELNAERRAYEYVADAFSVASIPTPALLARPAAQMVKIFIPLG